MSAGGIKLDLRQNISDRLEIISPNDVSLVKFLGAGGYGEVYLGKWHSSEAAIKCLNPSLFSAGGDGSHVSAQCTKHSSCCLAVAGASCSRGLTHTSGDCLWVLRMRREVDVYVVLAT